MTPKYKVTSKEVALLVRDNQGTAFWTKAPNKEYVKTLEAQGFKIVLCEKIRDDSDEQ